MYFVSTKTTRFYCQLLDVNIIFLFMTFIWVRISFIPNHYSIAKIKEILFSVLMCNKILKVRNSCMWARDF